MRHRRHVGRAQRCRSCVRAAKVAAMAKAKHTVGKEVVVHLVVRTAIIVIERAVRIVVCEDKVPVDGAILRDDRRLARPDVCDVWDARPAVPRAVVLGPRTRRHRHHRASTRRLARERDRHSNVRQTKGGAYRDPPPHAHTHNTTTQSTCRAHTAAQLLTPLSRTAFRSRLPEMSSPPPLA